MTDFAGTTRRGFMAGASAGVIALGLGAVARGATPAELAAPLRTKKSVVIGIANSLVYASTILASELGYFERENLSASLQTIDGGQTAQSLVATGRMDAAVAGLSAGMLNGIANGLETKMVALSGSVPPTGDAPSGLYVRKALVESRDVRAVADLKGRKLAGTALGSTASFFFALYLQEAGLTLNDVEYVELATAPTAVAITNGAVDAAFLTAPFSSQLTEQGVAVPLGDPHKILAPNCATGTVFGPNLLERDRQAGVAVLRAMVKVSRDLLQGDYRTRPEVVAALAKFTGAEPEIVRKNPVYRFNESLAPNIAVLPRMEQAFRPLGLLEYKNGLDPASVFDLELSRLAYESRA